MQDKKLQVGIIGIGTYAMAKQVPNLRATNRAEIVAISRRTERALAAAKGEIDVERAFTDWHDLLELPGLDAVIVATAHHAHVEPSLSAIAKGLPVLVEKPLALTSGDAWQMVDAAEGADTLLCVGYGLRSSGTWRSIKEAVSSGRLGVVRHVNLVFAHNVRFLWELDRLPDNYMARMPKGFYGDGSLEGYWRRNPEQMGGGPFADSGSHIVDVGLWIGGAPATTVSALMENAGLAVEQVVSVHARLENDVLLSIAVADGIQGKGGGQLTVLGEKGMLNAGFQGWGDPKEVWLSGDSGIEQLRVECEDSNPAADFVANILGEGPGGASGRDGAHAVALAEAAYRSAREGELVEIKSPQSIG